MRNHKVEYNTASRRDVNQAQSLLKVAVLSLKVETLASVGNWGLEEVSNTARVGQNYVTLHLLSIPIPSIFRPYCLRLWHNGVGEGQRGNEE